MSSTSKKPTRRNPNSSNMSTLQSPEPHRLWGQPDLGLSQADLRRLRQSMPRLPAKAWQDLVKTHEASTIEVHDTKRNSRYFLDLKEAAAYILACPQWFNTLQQPIMIVVCTRTWTDAAKFQYIFNILNASDLRELSTSMANLCWEPRWPSAEHLALESTFNSLDRRASHRLHVRRWLSRFIPSSRSWFSRLSTDVVVSSNSSQQQHRQHRLRHGCDTLLREPDCPQSWSHCSMSNCLLQGINSVAERGDNRVKNSFTIFWCSRRSARMYIFLAGLSCFFCSSPCLGAYQNGLWICAWMYL